MSETREQQYQRVEAMASGSDTWDLSENDLAALETVLADARAHSRAKSALYHVQRRLADLEIALIENGEPDVGDLADDLESISTFCARTLIEMQEKRG